MAKKFASSRLVKNNKVGLARHARNFAGNREVVPPPDHRCNLPFEHLPIWLSGAKWPYPPTPREGDSSVNRAIGNLWLQCRRVLIVDSSLSKGDRNPPGTESAAGHCARARLAKGTIIDIAGLRQSFSQRRSLRGLARKATLVNFSVEIGGESAPGRRKTLDIS